MLQPSLMLKSQMQEVWMQESKLTELTNSQQPLRKGLNRRSQ